MNEAAEVIYDLVDSEANLIFGAVVDPAMGQEVGGSWCACMPCIRIVMIKVTGMAAAHSMYVAGAISTIA